MAAQMPHIWLNDERRALPMDMSKLKKFVDFYEIYELVAMGKRQSPVSEMPYALKRDCLVEICRDE